MKPSDSRSVTKPGCDPELFSNELCFHLCAVAQRLAWKSLACALNLGLGWLPPPPAILASFSLTQKKNLFNSACACAVVACSHCQQGERAHLALEWRETSS